MSAPYQKHCLNCFNPCKQQEQYYNSDNCKLFLPKYLPVVVAGSRTIVDQSVVYKKIELGLGELFSVEELYGGKIQIVSGGAGGVDTIAELFAFERGYDFKLFRADWKKYGKKAGYIRNKQMAEYGKYLIAIWDGDSKGTAMMIDLAQKYNLKINVQKI